MKSSFMTTYRGRVGFGGPVVRSLLQKVSGMETESVLDDMHIVLSGSGWGGATPGKQFVAATG